MKRSLILSLAVSTLGLGCATTHSSEQAPKSAPQLAVNRQSAVPPSPDDAYRAEQPKPLDSQPSFEAPAPVQRKLKNGLTVLVHENHAVPLVVVEVLVKSGVDADPVNRPGISEFVASMLPEGTASMSSMDIARKLEDLAALLSSGAGLDGTRIHLNCLKETLPEALDVLADVVQHPAFRPEDVERLRGLRLTGLQEKKTIPQAMASDQMSRLLYGEKHPWGKPSGGTPESVRALKPQDLAHFHAKYFSPSNAQITVSGDVSVDVVVPLLAARFDGWKAHAVPRPKLPAYPVLAHEHSVLVDRPAATQSQVWFGTRIFPASSPDAMPMFVANTALGGFFSSRLNMNLREDKAYTYGARSTPSLGRDTGTFVASAGIFVDKTVDAVHQFSYELSHFTDVTDAELTTGKNAMIRSLPSALETNDAIASSFNTLTLKGLPLDYYATLPKRVDAVTHADVRRVVAKYINHALWQLVVVGPETQSKEGLTQLHMGSLEVIHDLAPEGGKAVGGAGH